MLTYVTQPFVRLLGLISLHHYFPYTAIPCIVYRSIPILLFCSQQICLPRHKYFVGRWTVSTIQQLIIKQKQRRLIQGTEPPYPHSGKTEKRANLSSMYTNQNTRVCFCFAISMLLVELYVFCKYSNYPWVSSRQWDINLTVTVIYNSIAYFVYFVNEKFCVASLHYQRVLITPK